MSNTSNNVLDPVYFRQNESKALDRKLLIDGVAKDLTGWSIELYINFKKLKTITEVTNGATEGLIKDQVITPGEFYFTILETDIADLTPGKYPAYIRFLDSATVPPNVFSNVTFDFIVLKA